MSERYKEAVLELHKLRWFSSYSQQSLMRNANNTPATLKYQGELHYKLSLRELAYIIKGCGGIPYGSDGEELVEALHLTLGELIQFRREAINAAAERTSRPEGGDGMECAERSEQEGGVPAELSRMRLALMRVEQAQARYEQAIEAVEQEVLGGTGTAPSPAERYAITKYLRSAKQAYAHAKENDLSSALRGTEGGAR